MEFCPKCGAILMVNGSKIKCPNCRYSKTGKINMTIKEDIETRPEIVVIDEKEESVNPVTDYECKKCKNKKAFFWLQQMRAGDEPESKFYKCTKCKNTVRVDD